VSPGFAERVWSESGPSAHVVRALLQPAAWLYEVGTAVRNDLYDRGILTTHRAAVPALSLGNLSVGGTGKTPVAAWAAFELRCRGAHPAIVLRGYGGDEPLVHRRLNADVPVVADPDRVRGVAEAARLGADCVVLDDAFQHRRIARVADWVLVSAEQWRNDASSLPAGPLRERAPALRRASVVIVTRKTASLDRAGALADELRQCVPRGASAVVHLAPSALVALDGAVQPIAWLAGRAFVAVAAVGDPTAFFTQLRDRGARVIEMRFPDHHRFTTGDMRRMLAAAKGVDGIVCTLKDAVKLAPRWRGAEVPLWYVSQAATVDRGRSFLDASLEAVLAARELPFQNAGPAGPSYFR
jgi:tetraacyldisaccharide 4'-kinase